VEMYSAYRKERLELGYALNTDGAPSSPAPAKPENNNVDAVRVRESDGL